MSIPVHRQSDKRSCGASTRVVGQGNVFVNNLLASVQGDPNTHGAGNLGATVNDGTVFINGKKVVLKGSAASRDGKAGFLRNKKHKRPTAIAGSPNVFACGGGSGSTPEGSDNTPDPVEPATQMYPDSSATDLAEEEAVTRQRDQETDPSSGGDITPAPGTVSEREQQAYDYFIAQGYTPEQAAGIVGNLTNESGLDPTAVNPNDAGAGKDSEGIAQWNRDRLDNLKDFAADRGTSYQDYETQLAFVDHELRGTGDFGGGSEASAYSRLESSTTYTDAAVAMSTYERYKGYELGIQAGETQQRAADAGRILTNYG